MIDPNSEVKHAVSALTTEILKLAPLDEDARLTLSVNLENAFSRLALAILAQVHQQQDSHLRDPSEPVPTTESAELMAAGVNG